MKKVLVTNVGIRDLTLNVSDTDIPCYLSFNKGEEGAEVQMFLNCDEGARAIASYVLAHPELHCRLGLPILTPALHLVLGQVENLDQMLLFATDQGEGAGEHRIWDTVESARLITKLIWEGPFAGRIADIETVTVSDNPQSYDLAYAKIGSELERHLPEDEHARTFVLLSGGIPALNSALKQHAIDMYGKQTTIIEIAEPLRMASLEGHHGSAAIVNSWPFRKDNILRMVRELLGRHDYGGVLQFLQIEGVEDTAIIVLLTHAQARLNMNFDDAYEILGEVEDFKIGKPHQWRVSAMRKWGRQRLADVAWSAQIAFQRGDLVGFVSRVATFCETYRRQLVRQVTGLHLDRGILDLSDALNVHEDLPTFLYEKKLKTLGDGWSADRLLLNALIDWGKTKDSSGRKAESIKNAQQSISSFGGLENLRNKAVHQLEGVSTANIEKTFHKAEDKFLEIAWDALRAMANVERATSIGTAVVEDIYIDINEEIINRLKLYEHDSVRHVHRTTILT